MARRVAGPLISWITAVWSAVSTASISGLTEVPIIISRLDEDATASEADLKVPEKQASAEELRSSMKPAGGFTLNSFGDSGVWPGSVRPPRAFSVPALQTTRSRPPTPAAAAWTESSSRTSMPMTMMRPPLFAASSFSSSTDFIWHWLF